ncbi:MAG: hypothetical protein AB1425_05755 [Actinomycetota bacterium]
MTETATGLPGAATIGGSSVTHALYGVTLASGFPFANRLAEGEGEPELTFDVVDEPPVTGWEEDTPAFASSPELDGAEESLVRVYRRDGCHVLCLTGVADYYLWPDRIACHLRDPAYGHLIEIHLLGIALSLWLELRGIPALHASAVVIEGRAVGFLATNKGGKSSLSAALMQAGYPLLTDDILPVEIERGAPGGRPGYPQMRMWPDQALHFLGRCEDLEIVHPAYSKRRVPVGEEGFGAFCGESRPLGCLFLPERRDPAVWGTEIEFEQLTPLEALMALIGQSFAPNAAEALGLRRRRLEIFSALVSRVPVRRVIYPEGYSYLPRVRGAILEDLARLP